MVYKQTEAYRKARLYRIRKNLFKEFKLKKVDKNDFEIYKNMFVAELSNIKPGIKIGLRECIFNTLNTLKSKRGKEVIIFRYGLDNGYPRTLKEVSNIIGITMERVGQIEAKAIRTMRHPSRSKKLRDYTELL